MEKDELLKIANEKYPIGTIYIDPAYGQSTIIGVLEYYTVKDKRIADVYKVDTITDGYGGAVYRDGVFHEIVGHRGY